MNYSILHLPLMVLIISVTTIASNNIVSLKGININNLKELKLLSNIRECPLFLRPGKWRRQFVDTTTMRPEPPPERYVRAEEICISRGTEILLNFNRSNTEEGDLYIRLFRSRSLTGSKSDPMSDYLIGLYIEFDEEGVVTAELKVISRFRQPRCELKLNMTRMSFKKSRNFEISMLVNEDNFDIAINGEAAREIYHKVPAPWTQMGMIHFSGYKADSFGHLKIRYIHRNRNHFCEDGNEEKRILEKS